MSVGLIIECDIIVFHGKSTLLHTVLRFSCMAAVFIQWTSLNLAHFILTVTVTLFLCYQSLCVYKSEFKFQNSKTLFLLVTFFHMSPWQLNKIHPLDCWKLRKKASKWTIYNLIIVPETTEVCLMFVQNIHIVLYFYLNVFNRFKHLW